MFPVSSNGMPLGFNMPISTEYWDDPQAVDGEAEAEAEAAVDDEGGEGTGGFAAMKRRIEEEGTVLIKGTEGAAAAAAGPRL